MEEAIQKLQEEYCVKISSGAITVAVDGVASFAPDKLPEHILDEACKIVTKEFIEFGHEVGFYEKEYQLRQALVELIELYRDGHVASQLWVKRLRAERDSASFYVDNFLQRWDFTSAMFVLYASYITSSYSHSSSTCNVRQLLDDIHRRIIGFCQFVLTVTDSHVAEVISRLTDVPITRILPSVDAHRKKAAYMTRQRVVNQEYLISDIFRIVASPRLVTMRPAASFILLGPSGVGKREIAYSVARYWYCDATRLVEIDMSDYADPLPDGDDLLTRLAQVVRRRPYTVFLLKHIDKASSTVVKKILEEVLSPEGNTFDFSKTIFFMTADVTSNQFTSSCRCYPDSTNLWDTCSTSPLEFYRNHKCVVKNRDRDRESVIVKARRIIGDDLLQSVDKVLIMEKIHDQKAVGRLMIRDIARDIYGQRIIVHASNAALDAIFLKARAYAKTQHLEGGKAFRQALLEHVIPKLHSLLPGVEGYGNVSVCIDTLVGTSELSYRFQTHGQDVWDYYFKLPKGTFRNFLANLRLKIEAISKVFSLRRQCLCLMDSEQSNSQNYSEVGKKLLLEVCSVISEAFSSPDPSIRLWEETFPDPSPSQRSAFKEIASSKEKHKLRTFIGELREKDATGIATATLAILDALVKPSPNFPSKYFIFEGLNNGAKVMLISYLTKSLGNSFFTHVKLDEDNCRSGEEVRNMLIDRVKKRPCMVLLIDRVEFADDVLYKSLLEIFDKGTMDDIDGLSVDFQRSIVILTSNVGNKYAIGANMFKHQEEVLSETVRNYKDDVRSGVRTELFYRVDHVMFFDPLSPESGPIRSLSLTKRPDGVEGPYSMLYQYVCMKFEGVFQA